MGCGTSREAAKAAADPRLGMLMSPRVSRRLSSKSLENFEAVSPMVADDDAKLEKLKLPLNEDMQEDELATEEEKAFLKEEIEARLEDADGTMKAFDETSKTRLFRGMITNNKGPMEKRIEEAVEMYGRVGAWLNAHGDVLEAELPGESVMFSSMGSTLGGQDLYGHVVWAEKLGDIGAIVDFPVSTEGAAAIRMKIMEAIRAAQIRANEARGPQRYKQVYIIDLGQLSITSLMARPAVRAMTLEIVKGANAFYPECLWKLFIVNAPFVFRSVYSMVSPLIHEVTKKKIKILGGPRTYFAELEKNGIPRSAVPTCLGGGCPDAPLQDLIRDLVADGFPRAARKTKSFAVATDAAAEDAPSSPRGGGDGAAKKSAMILPVVAIAAAVFAGSSVLTGLYLSKAVQ